MKNLNNLSLLAFFEGLWDNKGMNLQITGIPQWLKAWRFNTQDELKAAEIAVNRVHDKRFQLCPSNFYEEFKDVLLEVGQFDKCWFTSVQKEVDKEQEEVLFQWMNEHDNIEIFDDEWKSSIFDSVDMYNQIHGTKYNPETTFDKWWGKLVLEHVEDSVDDILTKVA